MRAYVLYSLSQKLKVTKEEKATTKGVGAGGGGGGAGGETETGRLTDRQSQKQRDKPTGRQNGFGQVIFFFLRLETVSAKTSLHLSPLTYSVHAFAQVNKTVKSKSSITV